MTAHDPVTVIANYNVAFAEANPGRDCPQFLYGRGWYTILGGFSPFKYRRRQIEKMTAQLRERAVAIKAEADDASARTGSQ